MDLVKYKHRLITAGLLIPLLVHCGGAGKKQSYGVSSSVGTLSGSIAPQAGNSGDLVGWQIALVDSATGESRVAEIDAGGGFEFASAASDGEYTIVLMNAEHRIVAILSMPSASDSGGVYQYFTPLSTSLPRLNFNGQSLRFADASKVTVLTHLAKDADLDGIPDGLETSTSLTSTSPSSKSSFEGPLLPGIAVVASDSELDASASDASFDIDADGLPNWFDQDDNGNDTIDIFDLDANADDVVDSTQNVGDHHFNSGVEYIATQIFHKDDGAINLKFSVKLEEGLQPKSVSILGSKTLFDESLIVVKGTNGSEEPKGIWKKELLDDGSSHDDGAKDQIYAQKIKLKANKEIQSNSMIFFRLDFGTYTRDYPYLLPYIESEAISFTYTSSSRKVTKSGDPFGDGEDNYLWSVSVYDEDGRLVHNSGTKEGTLNTYVIPADDIPSGSSYTAKVFAQTLDKIAGFPVITVESEEEDL